MAHDVFISHSSKDKQVADALCAALESERIRCWLAPRDVSPGSDWASEIVRAIQSARLMVLVFSENAADSAHIRKELTSAANAGVTIVPLKIDGTIPSGAMEYYLADTHWLDAVNPPTTEQITEVVRRVANLLEKEFDAATLVVPEVVAAAPDARSGHRVPWIAIAAALAAVLVIGGGIFAATQLLGPGAETAVDDTTPSFVAADNQALPSGTSEEFAYADVVAGLPGEPMDFEADIHSSLSDSEYLWLEFKGRWDGHDLEGSLTFLDDTFFIVGVTAYDGKEVDGTSQAEVDEALQDPDLAYFWTEGSYFPYGAKITSSYAFSIGEMKVERGDTLTFDQDLRLVKAAW